MRCLACTAGAAHKNLGADAELRASGVHPLGSVPDVEYVNPNERPRADEDIKRLLPLEADPVYGRAGPLLAHWGRT